jgi:hypothetical protein
MSYSGKLVVYEKRIFDESIRGDFGPADIKGIGSSDPWGT